MDKMIGKFTKEKNSKYISHLDLMRLFQRAFRRANIDLKHTEGFNPQPKIVFATALSLGTSSEGEYIEAELEEEIAVDKFIDNLNAVLPKGIKILKAKYSTEKGSIASFIRWGTYIVEVMLEDDIDKEELEEKLSVFLNLDEIVVSKQKKKKSRKVMVDQDVKHMIKSVDLLLYEDKKATFKITLMTGSNGNLKPELFFESLEKYTDIRLEKYKTKIHRLDLYIEEDGDLVAPI